MTEAEVQKRGKRKLRTGEVVSVSGNKSVVVQGERRKRHAMYSKVIRITRKYHVHDERSEAKVGDRVQIMECRPISKLKRWRLVSVENNEQAAS